MSLDLREHPSQPQDNVYCPRCEGRGVVVAVTAAPSEMERCQHCDGAGIMPAGDADCEFSDLTLYLGGLAA